MIPGRILLGVALTLGLAGCGSLPRFRTLPCGGVDAGEGGGPPAIQIAASGERSTTIDVLTYNIEGLQWPARSGRGRDLAAIGRILRDLRAAGTAPDVVLFQEVFSRAAVRGVVATGYPSLASGPSRTRRSVYSQDDRLPGRAKLAKGELGVRLMSSGLVIASRFAITGVARDPYSRRACAGFDCLSNKGVVLATLAVPGVPEGIDIANTHMNARKASKVAPARHRAAHRAQTRELEAFLAARRTPSRPMILGGDFNMRRSPARFDDFRLHHPFGLVHEYCQARAACAVSLSWDGDAPWLDTQDLQFFAQGTRVRIVPIEVRAMFDGAPGSPKLSDHDGLLVRYRLSWTGDAPPAGVCARIAGLRGSGRPAAGQADGLTAATTGDRSPPTR